MRGFRVHAAAPLLILAFVCPWLSLPAAAWADPPKQAIGFADFTPFPDTGTPLVDVVFQNGITGKFLVDKGRQTA